VPAEANPISASELVVDASLYRYLCGLPSWTGGDITGQVTEPVQLDLEGSTFTLQRIPDPTDPSTYPGAVINCQGDIAPLE
jgi:hypothetical protein